MTVLAEVPPAIIPNRWTGHGVDVCMVIRDGELRFVARDVYEALGIALPPHLASDPDHTHRLEVHATGTTWSRELLAIALGESDTLRDPTAGAQAFLTWVDGLIRDVEMISINRIVSMSTRQPLQVTILDDEVDQTTHAPTWYSVEDTARILSADPGIGRLTRTALFEVLHQRGWLERRDNTWWPHRGFLLAGFLIVNDVRIPASEHLYPQVCITPLAVEKLHKWLGGTHPFTLTPAGATP